MQLREAMISLMAAARRRTELPEDTLRPQDRERQGVGELLYGHYYPGSSNCPAGDFAMTVDLGSRDFFYFLQQC